MPYVLEHIRLHAKCIQASDVNQPVRQRGKLPQRGQDAEMVDQKLPTVKLRRVRMDGPERYYGTIGH